MKKNFSILANKKKITSIAIGGFDGMHKAHQSLFDKLDENGAVIVIETGYANLTPKAYRQEYTKYPLVYFDLKVIKHLEGIEFLELLQKKFPKLNKIVVGFDFCFGKNRKYCIEQLKEFFKGTVQVVDEVDVENEPVHSRIIREHLKKDNLYMARKMLTRDYKIYGKKIKGQGLGSKNFVPTINLDVDGFLLPKEGVYITNTIINDVSYKSVTFLGHRVTTDGNHAVETHIIDKTINIDNELVAIEFLEKIRDNKKFASFAELKNQIEEDITRVK